MLYLHSNKRRKKEKIQNINEDAASAEDICEDVTIKRVNWYMFAKSISDRHFKRMFQMSQQCFEVLCKRISVLLDGVV